MTTPGIVITEFMNEDAAASLAEDFDVVYGPILVDDRERLFELFDEARAIIARDRTRALGMTVPAYDPFLSDDDPAWEGVESRPLDDILTQSDAVSIHVPLTGETRTLIDAHTVSSMQARSILVNTARGGIVDEDAVAGALRSSHLGGAALDVFAEEPLTEVIGSRYRNTLNLIATPHIAGISLESDVRVGETTADNGRLILGGTAAS